MRFSVTFPDDLITQIDLRAQEEEITRSEWVRNTCTQAITTSITTLEETIDTLRTENFYHLVDNAKLTTKNQELQAVIEGNKRGDPKGDNVTQEITTLKSELQHKDHLLAMQQDEIQWLRGEVAKLNDKIPMLPAPGDHKWWMFWK